MATTATTPPLPPSKLEVFEGIIETSPLDKREYRHITLPNGLECLLISDPTTEKCSACCDVAVGSMSDPEDVQGLAHFLEHMLFMGTAKYPVENEYSAFLNAHGGYSNAYTAEEHTVYYFDVQNEFFDAALDMFAAFFSCPLFSEDSTMKEMNAVDSENSKNLQNDTWRKFQLFKSVLARADHPYSSFSTGNLQTLYTELQAKGLNTRDLMLQFYDKYYSANLMRVVVYGSQSLDELQIMVCGSGSGNSDSASDSGVQRFAAVPNKGLNVPTFSPDCFDPKHLGATKLEVVPIRDTKSLSLFFPIPEVHSKYLSKPTRYLSHLLGHESDGSILAYLKQRQWANGLGSYCYASTSAFACFCVNIDLTDLGKEFVEDITASVFSYIGMLQSVGAQQWVWQEMKEVMDMEFRFVDKIEPADYAVQLANGMHAYGGGSNKAHIVSGSQCVFECRLDETMQYLSKLTPRNCVVQVSHQGFAGHTTRKERWYDTDYNEQQLSAECIARWERCLQVAAETPASAFGSLSLANQTGAAVTGGGEAISAVVAGASASASAGDADSALLSVLRLPKRNEFIATDFSMRCVSSSNNHNYNEKGQGQGEDQPPLFRTYPKLLRCVCDIDPAKLDVQEVQKAAVGPDSTAVPTAATATAAEDDTDENCTKGGGDDGEEEEEEQDDEDDNDEVGASSAVVVNRPASRQLCLFYVPDTLWHMPKLNVAITLTNSCVQASALATASASLLGSCLEEVLTEYSYYADCAGLRYNVQPQLDGLVLFFQGYSHKLPLLMNKALEEMRTMADNSTTTTTTSNSSNNSSSSSLLYARMKEKTLRRYKNMQFQQPYQQCIRNLSGLLDNSFTPTEKYMCLEESNQADFEQFTASFCRRVNTTVLVHGNATEDEAISISNNVLSTLRVKPVFVSHLPLQRCVLFPAGCEYVLRSHCKHNNPNEKNSALCIYYMLQNDTGVAGATTLMKEEGKDGNEGTDVVEQVKLPVSSTSTSSSSSSCPAIDDEAMLALLAHIMSEPAFDQLRTKEQLGYIVFTGASKLGSNLVLRIIVQSTKDPHFLDERVEAFLEQFRAELAMFTLEKLQENVTAVREQQLEKPKNNYEEFSELWREVDGKTFLFHRKELLATALTRMKVTVQSLLAFFDLYVARSSPVRRKVASHFYGRGTSYKKQQMKGSSSNISAPAIEVQYVDDIAQFKRSMPLQAGTNHEPTAV